MYKIPTNVSLPVSPPRKKPKISWRPSFPRWRTPSWMRRSPSTPSPDVVTHTSTTTQSERVVEPQLINVTPRESADIGESSPAWPDHGHRDYSNQTTMGGGTFMHAPSTEEAQAALDDLKRILKPPRDTGRGYKDPGLGPILREHLDGMKQFLWAYVNPQSLTYGKWTAASLSTASALEQSTFHARILQD